MAQTTKGFELIDTTRVADEFDIDKFLNGNWNKANTLLVNSDAEADALLQGARNYNLVNGGEIKWGVTANVLSWSKVMNIFPAGGKLVRGGASVRAITLAIGSVTLPNAGDCMYIVLPSTDNATVVPAVANVTAIPSANTLILAVRDVDSVLYFFGSGEIPYGTTQEVGGKKDAYVQTNLITAVNDFLIGLSAGKVQKKTLAETQAILGASIALTGNPTAPTPTAGDNDLSIANTAFVKALGDTKLPIGGKAADSDLFDGVNSNGYLNINCVTISDGNLAIDPWITYHVLSGGTNVPTGAAEWFVTVQKHSNGHLHQVWRSFNTGSLWTVHREFFGGTWTAFATDWNTVNGKVLVKSAGDIAGDVQPPKGAGGGIYRVLTSPAGMLYPMQYGVGCSFSSGQGGGEYTTHVYNQGGNMWTQGTSDGGNIALANWKKIYTEVNAAITQYPVTLLSSLVNGAVDTATFSKFFRNVFNEVTLIVNCKKSGTSDDIPNGTHICTLPAGYRPDQALAFSCTAIKTNNTICPTTIRVSAEGYVHAFYPDGGFAVKNITFECKFLASGL